MSSVPTSGSLSLEVTFLFRARFSVPAGTKNQGVFPHWRLKIGTLSGTGVPQKEAAATGSSKHLILRSAAVAAIRTAKTQEFFKILIMISSSHFLGCDGKSGLRGDSLVGFMNRVFTAESLMPGQFNFAVRGCVEKVFQVRLMWRFIEEHRNFIFRQLRVSRTSPSRRPLRKPAWRGRSPWHHVVPAHLVARASRQIAQIDGSSTS